MAILTSKSLISHLLSIIIQRLIGTKTYLQQITYAEEKQIKDQKNLVDIIFSNKFFLYRLLSSVQGRKIGTEDAFGGGGYFLISLHIMWVLLVLSSLFDF